MGGRLVNNRIHHCEQFGISFNDHMNGPGAFATWMFNNKISDCAAGDIQDTKLVTKLADPGGNPNRPQSWYQPTNASGKASR
jgi:hypothetical protein